MCSCRAHWRQRAGDAKLQTFWLTLVIILSTPTMWESLKSTWFDSFCICGAWPRPYRTTYWAYMQSHQSWLWLASAQFIEYHQWQLVTSSNRWRSMSDCGYPPRHDPSTQVNVGAIKSQCDLAADLHASATAQIRRQLTVGCNNEYGKWWRQSSLWTTASKTRRC